MLELILYGIVLVVVVGIVYFIAKKSNSKNTNDCVDGASGSGNDILTLNRTDGTDITVDLSHEHGEYITDIPDEIIEDSDFKNEIIEGVSEKLELESQATTDYYISTTPPESTDGGSDGDVWYKV